MEFRIHVTDEELEIIKVYAERHALPLEKALKQALIDYIDEENQDYQFAVEAIEKLKASDEKTIPHEELWAILEAEEEESGE